MLADESRGGGYDKARGEHDVAQLDECVVESPVAVEYYGDACGSVGSDSFVVGGYEVGEASDVDGGAEDDDVVGAEFEHLPALLGCGDVDLPEAGVGSRGEPSQSAGDVTGDGGCGLCGAEIERINHGDVWITVLWVGRGKGTNIFRIVDGGGIYKQCRIDTPSGSDDTARVNKVT